MSEPELPLRQRIVAAFRGDGPIPTEFGPAWIADAPDTVPSDAKPKTRAAVLIPLVDRPEGMTVLLTRRTAHLKAHAGQISFPGGRAQEEDETPEDTALRETEEEVGLARDHIELIGRLSTRETATGFRVVPVVGCISPPFALRPDPGEVEEVFEVPLDFALDPLNHKFESRVQDGLERQFYVVPFERYYIWGLTARLLVNLSEMLRR